MATYTFQPTKPDQFVDWSDDAVWVGGLVPNSADADVVIPLVTLSSGDDDTSFLSIGIGESYLVNSLSLMSDYLTVVGTLSVASDLTIQPGGEMDMAGGTVEAGAILNNGSYDIQGNGQITTTGVLTNDRLIIGSGLTLTLGGLNNSEGTLEASSGNLTVQVATGFVDLSGSTLTGGTYSAGYYGNDAPDSNILYLDVGNEITNDGANISLDSGGEIESYDATTLQYVSIQSTLTSISTSGSLTVEQDDFTWVPLVVDGALHLSDSATLDDSLLTLDSGGEVDGVGTIDGTIINSGTITAGILAAPATDVSTSDTLKIAGTISGLGQLEVARGFCAASPFAGEQTQTFATLELSGPVSEDVAFGDGSGTLQLDDPAGFAGTITPSGICPSGFFDAGLLGPSSARLGDKIVLEGVSLASVTSWNYAGQGNSGILTIVAGGVTYALDFGGDFSNASFAISAGPRVFSDSTPSLVVQITVPPAVTSLTSSPSSGGNALIAGETVRFTLVTSDRASLTNAALTLSNGASAIYSGPPTSAASSYDDAIFSYTIAASDASTADLKVTGYTGSIVDPAGQALNPADVFEDTGIAIDIPAAPAIATGTYGSRVWKVSGTSLANAPITVYDGAKELGTTKASAEGAWTFKTSEGAGAIRDFTATTVDTLGNVSPASGALFEGTAGNDTFDFASGADLLSVAGLHGRGGTDTVEFTAAATLNDADFANVHGVHLLMLSGASSASLGSEASEAGIITVKTGAGATSITDALAKALRIGAGALGATLTLAGKANFTVTGLKTNLAGGAATGKLAVTAIGKSPQAIVLGSGADRLTAAHGGDTITGGGGADKFDVVGHKVADQFVYDATSDSLDKHDAYDIISGFVDRGNGGKFDDVIDLSAITGITTFKGALASPSAEVAANSVAYFYDASLDATLVFANASATSLAQTKPGLMEIELAGGDFKLAAGNFKLA